MFDAWRKVSVLQQSVIFNAHTSVIDEGDALAQLKHHLQDHCSALPELPKTP